MEVSSLFGGVYKGKNILVTGNTGFKGSWLVLWLKKMGANVTGFSVDGLNQGSHFDLLHLNIETVTGDIRNKEEIAECVRKCQPEIIFHLAAQSLVRRSYRDPYLTFETNIIGTLHVLEAARNCKAVKAFVNVTTDKVYENEENHKAYSEDDALGGYDPYSSSKACSEILSSSYRRSFLMNDGFLLATARAGNVIGGGDWADERLIPDMMRAAFGGETATIRNPDAIRPWEHVLEPLSGYLLLGQRLLEGKGEFARSWNFGPEMTECVSVKKVTTILSEEWERIKVVEEQGDKKMHEAAILKLDCSRSKKELGWAPVWNLSTALKRTTAWYREYFTGKRVITEGDLDAFLTDAVSKKITWTN
ncbi:MAG TPA: CDP-glucose 4,6-dehydratase [Bacteroidia bacterium]|jgi:CDP-glucose 4,6-dehydratase|nr:CDP-glucose 4,6-dehydratase [Bacteroidia bacterium]